MPFAFEEIALRSQVADNSADFMGGKSRIRRDGESCSQNLASKSPDRTWMCGGSPRSFE
jgi:hypothetical protein